MSQRNVLFVMDPITSIKPYKDSTLAMMLECQRRGHQVWYTEPQRLYLQDGTPYASVQQIQVFDDNDHWYELSDASDQPLARLDAILMRKDPPFDMDFVYCTYLLEAAERQGCLVVNRPSSLRDMNEKLTATWFPQCMTPSLVTSEAARIREFVSAQEHAVLKPLDGMGGTGIFQVRKGDPNLNSIIETLTQDGQELIMAQRYIPEITAGDKRILMVNGIPAPYALARIPPADDFRGNIARGGRGEGVELSERDRWICDQVAPELVKHGILFAGLDVIGDYLTEVNVTSPTCIRELDKAYGLNIAADLFTAIEARW